MNAVAASRNSMGAGRYRRARPEGDRISGYREEMDNDKALRDQLIELLDWGNAHMRFDEAVKDFPSELRGKRPPGGQHSAWELLEHLRLAVWDIVEFTRDAKTHVSPPWPSGYWPTNAAPPNEAAWDESVAAYRKHLG